MRTRTEKDKGPLTCGQGQKRTNRNRKRKTTVEKLAQFVFFVCVCVGGGGGGTEKTLQMYLRNSKSNYYFLLGGGGRGGGGHRKDVVNVSEKFKSNYNYIILSNCANRRETDRQTDRDRDRQSQRDTERDRDRELQHRLVDFKFCRNPHHFHCHLGFEHRCDLLQTEPRHILILKCCGDLHQAVDRARCRCVDEDGQDGVSAHGGRRRGRAVAGRVAQSNLSCWTHTRATGAPGPPT